MEVIYIFGFVLLLLLAWFLGRLSAKGSRWFRINNHEHYVKGINFLVNQQPDEAMDTFINFVEVNAETLDTHLAIGKMMRQRGEVERAIKVHQNLLTGSSLNQYQQQQAQLELAKDYLKAGLLDRSERLLLELVESEGEHGERAAQYLVDIYQDEQEWEKAISAGEHISRGIFHHTSPELMLRMSQFCCELAAREIAKNRLQESSMHIKQARKYNPSSVRVHLLSGELAVHEGDYQAAISEYQAIPDVDNRMLVETLKPLQQCFESIDNTPDFVALLQKWLDTYEDDRVLAFIAIEMPKISSYQTTWEFISTHLELKPSAIGLRALLDVEINLSDEGADTASMPQERLIMMNQLIEKLLKNAPGYRCQSCGFRGGQLHWLCPQCKSWETIKPVQAF